MKKGLFLLLLLQTLASAQQPTLQTAVAAVRQGKAPEALQLLDSLPDTPEVCFWRGRAQIDLKRPQQASANLQKVPEQHPLYPYAAKGLIHCAWVCPQIDYESTLRHLLKSSHNGIVNLARAALSEQELRKPASSQPQDTKKHPDLTSLQQIDQLRQQGRYAEAIELCRNLESNQTLPVLQRQRVRLALADVYYEQEASLQGDIMTPEEEEIREQEDGKGEETLLQFISSNPDSPLMEEAFRRLHQHQAFTLSKYALLKLREWMEDTSRPRRAVLSMMMLQHLFCPDDSDPTYANTASSRCPREQTTQTILQEYVRRLLVRKDSERAQTYLRLMEQNTPRKLFYEASTMSQGTVQAAKDFERSALQADETLRPVALANALACALASGQTGQARALMEQPGLPDETRALLLLTSATHTQRTAPKDARSQLENALDCHPSAQLTADIRMGLACLSLPEEPGQARQQLEALETPEQKMWSEQQEQRFYALWEAVIRSEQREDAQHEILRLVHRASTRGLHAGVRDSMTLHEAELLAQAKQPSAALATLQNMLNQRPLSPYAPMARLLKARLTEQLGTLQALKQAVNLYAECSRPGEPYAPEATIARATILARINRCAEAIELVQELLKRKDSLSLEQQAHALSVLADAHAAANMPNSPAQALETCEQILQIPDLPRDWQIRTLLQRAALNTRYQNTDDALEDYQTLLAMLPRQSASPTQQDWQLLYLAGGSAVSLYEKAQRPRLAAELAESIARAFPNCATPGGDYAQHFLHWAARIRQTNFLPATKTQRHSHQTAR